MLRIRLFLLSLYLTSIVAIARTRTSQSLLAFSAVVTFTMINIHKAVLVSLASPPTGGTLLGSVGDDF